MDNFKSLGGQNLAKPPHVEMLPANKKGGYVQETDDFVQAVSQRRSKLQPSCGRSEESFHREESLCDARKIGETDA